MCHQTLIRCQPAKLCNKAMTYNVLLCRNNASVDCSLDIAPCIFDGSLYTTVPAIQSLGFSIIDPMDFAEGYVGCPAYGFLVCALSFPLVT